MRGMIGTMADGDGRYGLEIDGKQVVLNLYTVEDQLYYDVMIDGNLVSKQGSAQQGEDHRAVIARLRRTIESAS